MQGNRGKDTKPELLVRRLLREAGYPGYRLHWKQAPGRPDVAYPGRRVAIFVNGCYWHRCPHCQPARPKAHAEYWDAKFVANEERDARKTAQLEAAGWTVVTIWECQLRSDARAALQPALDALDSSGG
jgi:DNA mismatch endonuclease (patch repair protein)